MSSTPIRCPGCQDPGKGLRPITLQHLLTAEALAEVGDGEGYRHCPAQGCEVAYFNNAGHTVGKGSVTVRIGTKETEDRPLCYCFGHSWESIEAQVAATGDSDAAETITAHCRAGDDRCPELNPQGSCCLANIRRATAEAKAKLSIYAGAREG